MLVTIPEVLNKEDISVIRDLMATANFREGTASAGSEAKRVKNNHEMFISEIETQRLNNLVMGKLVQNPTYIAAAFAKKIAAPFYAKYTEGMFYGNHVDDPIMGPPNQRYRTDISITIFLNEPEDYDGGELVISTAFGHQKVKLNAGDAVMYPSSSTHQVAEVTRGERLVAVTWLQSTIPDPAKREILYNLSQARETMIKTVPGSAELEQVSNSYVNLLRMWSDI
ncbi:MAG: Fe2+-dependent dioxygenase [Gammaproteobacteria bacterium]|jgi:PKHD-type hydroxylase|nr:Fe2+-dependent dioxygenase [Gammaproteobacteria bacterium]